MKLPKRVTIGCMGWVGWSMELGGGRRAAEVVFAALWPLMSEKELKSFDKGIIDH